MHIVYDLFDCLLMKQISVADLLFTCIWLWEFRNWNLIINRLSLELQFEICVLHNAATLLGKFATYEIS